MCITWNGYLKSTSYTFFCQFFPFLGLYMKLVHFFPEILVRTGSFSSPVFHGVLGFLVCSTSYYFHIYCAKDQLCHTSSSNAQTGPVLHALKIFLLFLSFWFPSFTKQVCFLFRGYSAYFFFYKPLPGVNDSNYPICWLLEYWKQPWLGISLGLVTKGN